MIKVTGKMVKYYLMDCLGYDNDMISELKEIQGKIDSTLLSDRELKDCINYYN